MIYQMLVKCDNPDRFLPPSWNFHRNPDMTVWETALDIAERENVTVVRIVDERGRNVPRGT